MINSLAFVPGAQLHPINFNDLICYSIQPLIQAVLDRFTTSQDLDTAIEDAIIAIPILMRYNYRLNIKGK